MASHNSDGHAKGCWRNYSMNHLKNFKIESYGNNDIKRNPDGDNEGTVG